MQVQEYRSPAAAPPDASLAAVPGPPPAAPAGQARLGGAIASVAVMAVGLVGIVDLTGADVPAAAYFAAPLVVIALGLILATRFGRARWLIPIGAVLCLALGVSAAAEDVASPAGSTTWRPASITELNSTYRLGLGSAVLDLSALDFTGRSESVTVSVDVGDLTIIVSGEVDVRVETTVDVGNALVFGTQWGGIGQSNRTITDAGPDGPGGGELAIRATVDVGDVDVRR